MNQQPTQVENKSKEAAASSVLKTNPVIAGMAKAQSGLNAALSALIAMEAVAEVQESGEDAVEAVVETTTDVVAEAAEEEGLLSGLFGGEILALGAPAAGAVAAAGAISAVGGSNSEGGESATADASGPFPSTGTPADMALAPLNDAAAGTWLLPP
ncbi:MAG: hypothetical protein LW629_07330 [Burkholderiales bacterium]|nr:hypothetical protein [Burkholderiales bacterium]